MLQFSPLPGSYGALGAPWRGLGPVLEVSARGLAGSQGKSGPAPSGAVSLWLCPRAVRMLRSDVEVSGHGDLAQNLLLMHPLMGNIDGCLKNLMRA